MPSDPSLLGGGFVTPESPGGFVPPSVPLVPPSGCGGTNPEPLLALEQAIHERVERVMIGSQSE
jgi:hypothetical protein